MSPPPGWPGVHRAVGNFLVSDPDASRATLRQRRWVLEQALEELAQRDARVTPETLVSQDFVDAFLAQPGNGQGTRRRATPELSEASMRARLSVLRRFAQYIGAPLPQQTGKRVAPRVPLGRVELTFLLMRVAGPARGADPSPSRVRLAAVLARMWLEPVRTGPLLAMTTQDVLCDAEGRPFAVKGSAGQLLPLQPVVSSTFAEWLMVRRQAVGHLEGAPHDRLWVTVRTVPEGTGRAFAAGLPLRARGLQRSYAKVIAEVNDEQAGQPGFPLPRSLDLLRLSLLKVTRPDGMAAQEFEGR